MILIKHLGVSGGGGPLGQIWLDLVRLVLYLSYIRAGCRLPSVSPRASFPVCPRSPPLAVRASRKHRGGCFLGKDTQETSMGSGSHIPRKWVSPPPSPLDS